MLNKLKKFIKEYLEGNLFLIFILLIGIGVVLGLIFNYNLNNLNNDKISDVINKFSSDSYTLPYYIAERYIIWLNMRQFLFWLNYSLSIFSIIASLMTVYYIAKKNEERKKKQIIFLSLLSISLTIGGLIINPGRRSLATQHAWRELDSCIIQTINDNSLSNENKNKVISNKIIEMEQYMELKED